MKRYTSSFFKVVALIYILFPVSFGTSTAILFDIPLVEMVPLALSPFFYIVCALAILSGIGLWEVKRWAWHAFMVSNAFVLYQGAYVAAHFGSGHHKVIALVFLALTLLIFVYRVTAELRVPYLFPRIRWWETGARGVCAIAAEITGPQGEKISGEILDLSMHGCFVKTPADLPLEERIKIVFSHARQDFSCHGIVLWRAQSAVTHPRGPGDLFPASGAHSASHASRDRPSSQTPVSRSEAS